MVNIQIGDECSEWEIFCGIFVPLSCMHLPSVVIMFL
jgi:hypothetical protein